MASDGSDQWGGSDEPFRAFFDMQGEAMREMMGQFIPANTLADWSKAGIGTADAQEFAKVAREIQSMWFEFMAERTQDKGEGANPFDPAQWLTLAQGMAKQMPQPPLEAAQKLASDTMAVWQGVMGSFLGGAGRKDAVDADTLPRKDRRFAAEEWRAHPAFALLHQTYLMMAEYFIGAAKKVEGIAPEKRKQLEFATTALVEAMSPDNFILTNPVVLKRTIETKGQNLLKGMRHLINDLRRGQLTHTDAEAFELGVNLAATPGKVVHETPLYQ
ncbi:MAG TPA: class I poly(R)-hydroxyalkanoic acid synthase, partial [Erythrobacter sp.]|nr:class I poly(R)-hydroxyalkanoic acid synthase [Erythrobacter sp.]